MRVKAGMRSRVAQAGRQADVTNRAQMMMMMMTGMSAALTLLVAANTVSPTDPWPSEFEINCWTRSFGRKVEKQNIKIKHQRPFLMLETAVWPKKKQLITKFTYLAFPTLSATSHSLPQQKLLSCHVSVCDEIFLFDKILFFEWKMLNMLTKEASETFPPTLWPAPTEETNVIHKRLAILLKHKAGGELVTALCELKLSGTLEP